VAILRGNGDGTYSTPTWIGVGTGPEVLASGDVDGDGRRT